MSTEVRLKTGIYPLEGKGFFIEGRKLVVLERKKEVHRKPKNYLAQLQPFQYISSLYPVGGGA